MYIVKVSYLDRPEMVNPIIQIVDNLEGSGVGMLGVIL
jgi:hypothetical protein